MMSKKIILLLCSTMLGAGCAGLFMQRSFVIHIKGSDTMRILTTRWAEAYMKNQPFIAVYAEGGETAQGIKSLIDGTADICAASRPLQASEAQLLAEKHGKLGMQFLVAKDALSIYVNPSNPVSKLSLGQLKQIFTGEIINWQAVGGNDQPIDVIIRSPSSGTFLYFREHVLEGMEYAPWAKSMPTTSAIVNEISQNPNAIGYGGIAYGLNVVHCMIEGVAATEENVRQDHYPIIRYLYLYTIDSPQGAIKNFIDFILWDGQRIVKEVGYVPLWEIQ